MTSHNLRGNPFAVLEAQTPVDEVVSEQAKEAQRPLDHNTSRRPGRSLASFAPGYVFSDRTTPCSLKNHGNPLPELIAFATCDVLGRFSGGR
jgi:hypothetical protein